MSKLELTVAEAATRLSNFTETGADFHARQIRHHISNEILAPCGRSNMGRIPGALLDEVGLCQAMALHTLATLNPGIDFVRCLKAINNVDGSARRKGIVEPSRGWPFAIARIRDGAQMFAHLVFPQFPFDGQFGEINGFISDKETVEYGMPIRAKLVLPLHTILGPLLGAE